MEDDKVTKTVRLASHRRHAVETLKRCPLCGAINARSNGECYVCLWHGVFDFDTARVEAGLEELLCACPELADAMLELPEEGTRQKRPLVRFWQRFWAFIAARRRMRIQAIRRVFGFVANGEKKAVRSA